MVFSTKLIEITENIRVSMKITSKGEYALKALTELAIDHGRGNPVTLISDVAQRKGIPQKYLEQILLSLRNAGILVSKRGVGGGYSLSRSPENISLGEIIRAVEGTFTQVHPGIINYLFKVIGGTQFAYFIGEGIARIS